VSKAAPFADLRAVDRQELLDHMLAEDILVEADQRLILGEKGEKLYGRRHFMDLYVVFSVPRSFRVLWGPTEIGTIDSFFVEQKDEEDLAFVLAGKPWQVTHIDWRRMVCVVVPAPANKFPRWLGEPVLLSWALCQAMRDVLTDDVEDRWWSLRTRQAFETIRAEYSFLRDEPMPLTKDQESIRWWTFAGGKANNLLAYLLEVRLGAKVMPNNTALTFTEEAGKSESAIRQAVRDIRQEGVVSEEALLAAAARSSRTRISKFQPCLSERLELGLLAERLLDVESLRVIAKLDKA
ncbi:MAG: ATP-dependent helicase, partial [Deltaproteobacteria bacterium]|nr:ATP-dependent helicase [Deltaproteobacteria bacterium]